MKQTQQQIIKQNIQTKKQAGQDYKNGKIDLITMGQIMNSVYYSEVEQGISY